MWTNDDSGAVPARGLEQVQRADGIDVEIIKGPGGGQVVAGLGGGVNQQVRFERGEKGVNPGAVADIQFMMVKLRVDGLQAALVPAGVAAGAEEIRPRVVVDAIHFPACLAEIIHDLRPNKAG